MGRLSAPFALGQSHVCISTAVSVFSVLVVLSCWQSCLQKYRFIRKRMRFKPTYYAFLSVMYYWKQIFPVSENCYAVSA